VSAISKKTTSKAKETVDLDIGNGFYMNDYVMEKTLCPADISLKGE